MSKKIALLQSNYIPWKGYFDIINRVDEFILYDECQFTKNDWRNRNIIRVLGGTTWLTIPVRTSGRFGQTIGETLVADGRWARKHWQSLVTHYGRAPHFRALEAQVKSWYEAAADLTRLSDVNALFINAICGLLGIRTTISWSTDYPTQDECPTHRIVSICLQAGGSSYLSGPAARSYMRQELFREAGLTLEWMDYTGYPDYRQLHTPCLHQVTILDLIFNVGPDAAARYMLSFG